MSDIQIKCRTLAVREAKPYLNHKLHEVVFYFSENEQKKKAPGFSPISIGSRPTHKKLLPKLIKNNIISEQHAPILYDQNEWKVGEIVFYSLGTIKSFSSSYFRLENFTDRFRMAGGDLSRQHLQNLKRKPKSALLIDMSGLTEAIQSFGILKEVSKEKDLSIKLISAFIEGLYLGVYQYRDYKTSKKDEKKIPKYLDVFFLLSDSDKVRIGSSIINRARIAVEGVFRARNLVNAPPNDLHSESFVQEARKIASSLKVRCQVFGRAQLKKMKMNALLAVNSGSLHEAKLLVMDNCFAKKGKTILLVGKGVLFDSGGLSLKPSSAMNGMKMDMAGGAAVLAAFESLTKLKIQARLVAIVPLTDNMTGENAMKVGDVLRTRSGKTVEVLNTDAEGRLILCDALDYGIKTFKPDVIIDLATLTGACMVALGTYYAGLFTPSDEMAEKLLQSSQSSDEPLWRLPLDNLYAKELQSDIADLKNIGSSYGGAITAAKFLEQFVPEKYRSQWAHLDIAPVMDCSQTKGYRVKGGSGFGVRLLIDFVEKMVEVK